MHHCNKILCCHQMSYLSFPGKFFSYFKEQRGKNFRSFGLKNSLRFSRYSCVIELIKLGCKDNIDHSSNMKAFEEVRIILIITQNFLMNRFFPINYLFIVILLVISSLRCFPLFLPQSNIRIREPYCSVFLFSARNFFD